MCVGSSDGAKERRDGCHGMGGEHPVLVHRIQCGRVEPGAWRSGLVAAVESSILPARIHVYNVLGKHHLRALDFGRRVRLQQQ